MSSLSDTVAQLALRPKRVALDVPCRARGLFVPKPTIVEGYQRHSVLDLGQTVRECPLASTAVGGDCY
jgi:hypothetical protein